jgi:hypothetical protein
MLLGVVDSYKKNNRMFSFIAFLTFDGPPALLLFPSRQEICVLYNGMHERGNFTQSTVLYFMCPPWLLPLDGHAGCLINGGIAHSGQAVYLVLQPDCVGEGSRHIHATTYAANLRLRVQCIAKAHSQELIGCVGLLKLQPYAFPLHYNWSTWFSTNRNHEL